MALVSEETAQVGAQQIMGENASLQQYKSITVDRNYSLYEQMTDLSSASILTTWYKPAQKTFSIHCSYSV